MAARENQGLQISLMITVTLCLALAVVAYLLYSSKSEQVADLESQRASAQEARNDAQRSEDQNRELKEMMGFSSETTFDEVKNVFDGEMGTYAKNFPEDVWFYSKLVEYQSVELGKADESQTSLTEENQQLKSELAVLEEGNARQLKTVEDELTKSVAKVSDDNLKLKDQLKGREQKAQELEVARNTLRQEKTEIIAAKQKKEREDAREITSLTNTVASLTEEKRKLNDENFEIADRRVLRGCIANGLVWINIGSADGLRPKTTFKVYDIDENDAHISPSKGSIEVMRLLPGGAMAEARVTSDAIENPILRGDKIYTPLWHRGRRERFALVGVIDIDGDEKSDLAKVKSLIESSGGIVDAVMDDNGKIEGKMSVKTRFIVVGEHPDVAPSGEAVIDRKAVDNFTDMVDQSRKFGVTPISVEKFLDHIGWQPEEGNRAVGAGTKSDGFRPRRPTHIRY